MSCVVPRCRTKRYGRDSTISFHSFPKDKCKRDQWLAALHLNFNDLPARSMVCSLHFRKQDFHTDSRVYRSGLKPNVIPHLADELPDFEVIEMLNHGDENESEAQMISGDEDDDYEDSYNQSSNVEIPPYTDSHKSNDAHQLTSLELQREKKIAKANALRKIENILPLSIGLQHEKEHEPKVDSLGTMDLEDKVNFLQHEKEHEAEVDSLGTMDLEDKVKFLQKALVEKDRVIKLLNTKLRFKSERIEHLISKLKKKHKLINKKR